MRFNDIYIKLVCVDLYCKELFLFSRLMIPFDTSTSPQFEISLFLQNYAVYIAVLPFFCVMTYLMNLQVATATQFEMLAIRINNIREEAVQNIEEREKCLIATNTMSDRVHGQSSTNRCLTFVNEKRQVGNYVIPLRETKNHVPKIQEISVAKISHFVYGKMNEINVFKKTDSRIETATSENRNQSKERSSTNEAKSMKLDTKNTIQNNTRMSKNEHSISVAQTSVKSTGYYRGQYSDPCNTILATKPEIMSTSERHLDIDCEMHRVLRSCLVQHQRLLK